MTSYLHWVVAACVLLTIACFFVRGRVADGVAVGSLSTLYALQLVSFLVYGVPIQYGVELIQ
jgi:hypothetical protein